MKSIVAILFLLLASTSVAMAQGCGFSNPNCIAPTAPVGDNSVKVANTAWVTQATQHFAPSGTFSNFVNDDAPAINAALAAASAAGNGLVLLNPNQPYWGQTAITVPTNVALGCAAPPQKQIAGATKDWTNLGCSVYLAPNNPITNNGTILNARIIQDNIHFAGNPTTSHGLKTITNNFSTTGTGIINNSLDAIIQDVVVVGFNLDILDQSVNRGSIRHVLLEGQNCVKYANNIGDYLKGLDIECWPVYSTNRSISSYTGNISNVADNGSGAWRVSLSAAPSEPLVTGDEVFIGGSGSIGIPFGALGRHAVTVINPTTFDLTSSVDAPTIIGNTTTGQFLVSSLSSTANLWPGMTFTGACFSGTRTIKMMLQSGGFIADAAATSTTTGCSLTFNLGSFSGGGVPIVTFDATGGQHGVGVEFAGNGVLASNYYVWNHDTAFQFDSGVFTNIIELASIDGNPQEYRSERIGVLFQSGANHNSFSGYSQTSGGTFVVNQNGAVLGQASSVAPGRVDTWVWGAIENDTGSLIVSALNSPSGNAPGANSDGDVFNVNGQNLILANGTAIPNAVYRSDTGGVSGLAIDSGSNIGNYSLKCSNNTCFFIGALFVDGTAPTACVATAGTGATCSFSSPSSSSNGVVNVVAGTGSPTSGNVAVTFGQSLTGNNNPNCSAFYNDDNTAWPSPGALHATFNTGSINIFFSTGTGLTSGDTYTIGWFCLGR